MTLRKGRVEMAVNGVWVSVCVIWLVVTWQGNPWLHGFWWVSLLLFSARLIDDIYRPPLVYADGRLCVRPFKSVFARACLPVDEIVAVREIRRTVGGVFRLVEVPAFVFVSTQGDEIDYFPSLTSEPQLHRIREFLEQVPGLPGIDPAKYEDRPGF